MNLNQFLMGLSNAVAQSIISLLEVVGCDDTAINNQWKKGVIHRLKNRRTPATVNYLSPAF